jgi:hypothetical protein
MMVVISSKPAYHFSIFGTNRRSEAVHAQVTRQRSLATAGGALACCRRGKKGPGACSINERDAIFSE